VKTWHTWHTCAHVQEQFRWPLLSSSLKTSFYCKCYDINFAYLNVHVHHGTLGRVRGQHQSMRHSCCLSCTLHRFHGFLSSVEALAKRVVTLVELCEARGRVRECSEQIAPKTTKPDAGILNESSFTNEHGTRHAIKSFVKRHVDLRFERREKL